MEKKVESAASFGVQPVSENSAPAVGHQTKTPSVYMPGSTEAALPQKLESPGTAQAAVRPLTSGHETTPTFTFSRDSIVRSLQNMVSVPDSSRTMEDVELVEKQKSAFELAISMYMAATEFYDGGSLWCRQCDCIFTDISALCRHIHSDKHQLVSSATLPG